MSVSCKSCGDTRPPDTRCSHCGGHGLKHDMEGYVVECGYCEGGSIWPPRCLACSRFRKWSEGP